MFAPEEIVEQILSDIETGRINTLDELDARFAETHEKYPVYEWAWAADILQKRLRKTIDEVTAEDIVSLTARWKEAVINLDHQLYTDAGKEFAATVQTGFGLDGDEETKHHDFTAVRGTFEGNGFVTEIEKHIAAKTALADELLGRIAPLRENGS